MGNFFWCSRTSFKVEILEYDVRIPAASNHILFDSYSAVMSRVSQVPLQCVAASPFRVTLIVTPETRGYVRFLFFAGT
jgi:hypothetical protein